MRWATTAKRARVTDMDGEFEYKIDRAEATRRDDILRRMEFDEHGTPKAKLPNCPRCDEDELRGRSYNPGERAFKCYRCNWGAIFVTGS